MPPDEDDLIRQAEEELRRLNPVDHGTADVEGRARYGDVRWSAMLKDERWVASLTGLSMAARIETEKSIAKFVTAKAGFYNCLGFALVMLSLAGIGLMVWAVA